MMVRIATVLSAREWESSLVVAARSSASARLVRRAYQPGDLDDVAGEIDAIIAGAETAWVTPSRVATWRRQGLLVIGIFPSGDKPAAALLRAGGADHVLPDDVPAETILQTARFGIDLQDRPSPEPIGTVHVIVGARGAPGRTELSLALAVTLADEGPTLLLDLDLDAPALAIRTGLPPRPDVTDAVEAVRRTGVLPGDSVRRVGRLGVIVGSHGRETDDIRSAAEEDLVEAGAASAAAVVVDAGLRSADDPMVKRANQAVVVAEGSAVGLVRCARLIAQWAGPPPALVLNKVPASDRRNVVAAAREWTGLEPAVVVPDLDGVRTRARRARLPDRRLRRLVRPLAAPR